MADIFGYKRNPKPRGVFSSENSLLTFGGEGGAGGSAAGYLVQQWNVSYQQDVQEIFEIGSNNLYWVKGRPVGTASFGRILGSSKRVDTDNDGLLPSSAYDICNGGAQIRITAIGGHCDQPPKSSGGEILNNGVDIVMDGCVVTQIGFSMSVQDVRIFENYAWRFAWMEIKST